MSRFSPPAELLCFPFPTNFLLRLATSLAKTQHISKRETQEKTGGKHGKSSQAAEKSLGKLQLPPPPPSPKPLGISCLQQGKPLNL